MLNQAFNAKPYNYFDPQVGRGGVGGQKSGCKCLSSSEPNMAWLWLACQGAQGPEQAANGIGVPDSHSPLTTFPPNRVPSPNGRNTHHRSPSPAYTSSAQHSHVLHLNCMYLQAVTPGFRCPIPHFAVPLQSFIVHYHGPKPHDYLRYLQGGDCGYGRSLCDRAASRWAGRGTWERRRGCNTGRLLRTSTGRCAAGWPVGPHQQDRRERAPGRLRAEDIATAPSIPSQGPLGPFLTAAAGTRAVPPTFPGVLEDATSKKRLPIALS